MIAICESRATAAVARMATHVEAARAGAALYFNTCSWEHVQTALDYYRYASGRALAIGETDDPAQAAGWLEEILECAVYTAQIEHTHYPARAAAARGQERAAQAADIGPH